MHFLEVVIIVAIILLMGGYNKEASAHASDSDMNMFHGFK